jgi:hypothetical protein
MQLLGRTAPVIPEGGDGQPRWPAEPAGKSTTNASANCGATRDCESRSAARRKRLTGIGVAVGAMSPIRPNAIWAMDFQFDTTADGRTLKMLNVIDEFTREALAIEVHRGIDADGLVAVLDRLALRRLAPRLQRQQTPFRPRRTHPSRVRSTVDHDPPTPSRIAIGPPIGSPSRRLGLVARVRCR